jgi:AcrR family transcriptional regulator
MSARGKQASALPAREKIMRSASRLLRAKGFERLSLRAVARGARLAPSSLYEYFDGRDELLEAIATAALLDLQQQLTAACRTEGPAKAQLLTAAVAYLAFAQTRSKEFELVFSRTRPADQVAPPAHSPLLPIVAVIASAVESGEFVPGAGLSSLDLALGLWTQVHGIAVLRARYLADTVGFDEKARQIVAACIDAWSPRR